MCILGSRVSTAVLAGVAPVWKGRRQEDFRQLESEISVYCGILICKLCRGFVPTMLAVGFPQWQMLLRSSVEQSPGVHDGVSYVNYGAFQGLKGLLRSPVVRANEIHSTGH